MERKNSGFQTSFSIPDPKKMKNKTKTHTHTRNIIQTVRSLTMSSM